MINRASNNRRNNNSTEEKPSLKNLATAVLAAGSLTLGGSIYMLTKSESNTNTRHFDESGIVDNWSNTYAIAYEKLKNWEFLMVDAKWSIIDGIRKYPENWWGLSDSQKQAFYDSIRKDISGKYGIPNTEWSIRLVNPSVVLKNYPQGKTFEEIAKENGDKPVIGDEKWRSRIKYLEDDFANVTGDKTIDTLLQKHIAGKIAWESLFENGKTSHAGAIGIMQIMPSMINNKIVNPKNYPEEKVAQSYKMQVELARNLTASNYQDLKKFIKPLADKFFDGDVEKAKRDMIFPLLINSYNTGTTILRKNLQQFLEAYEWKEDLAKSWGVHYSDELGSDVFYHFSQFAKLNGESSQYSKDAQAYVFKTLGMSKAINGKADTSELNKDYSEILEESGVKTSPGIIATIKEKLAKIFSEEKSPNFVKWKYLEWELSRTELPRKIQKTHIDPWMEEFAEEEWLVRARTKKDMLYKSINPNPKNFAYKMVEVGMNDDGEKFGDKNDPDYTKLHPEAYDDLLKIQELLAEELEANYNLSSDYTPTLVITSIGRDELYSKKFLNNDSDNSSHLYGIAFDLRSVSGEITHKKTGKSITLTWKDGQIFQDALKKVLQKMHDSGEIFAMIEDNPPHYHITSRIDTDEDWKPKK